MTSQPETHTAPDWIGELLQSVSTWREMAIETGRSDIAECLRLTELVANKQRNGTASRRTGARRR